MLTRNGLAQLARSYGTVKTLSVYLDGTVRDPAERKAWRRDLDRRIRQLRDTLGDASHAEREAFDDCVADMDECLEEYRGALRAPGWVGFFPEDGVTHTEALAVAPPTIVAWGDGIRIAPYIRVLKQQQAAILALMDARRVRVYRYANATLEDVETLRAHAHVNNVGHLGYPPSSGFHTGTRGAIGADARERELRTGTADMLRELCDRLVTLSAGDAWILLGGIPEVVSDCIATLPVVAEPRVHRIELDVHASNAQVAAALEHGAKAARRARDLRLVDDILARNAAGGHGIIGIAPVMEALREHAVDVLCFTEALLTQHPNEAELLARTAMQRGSALELVSGTAAEHLDASGGVGASLRFVPLRSQPTALDTQYREQLAGLNASPMANA